MVIEWCFIDIFLPMMSGIHLIIHSWKYTLRFQLDLKHLEILLFYVGNRSIFF